jgi:hypothetical protein
LHAADLVNSFSRLYLLPKQLRGADAKIMALSSAIALPNYQVD